MDQNRQLEAGLGQTVLEEGGLGEEDLEEEDHKKDRRDLVQVGHLGLEGKDHWDLEWMGHWSLEGMDR